MFGSLPNTQVATLRITDQPALGGQPASCRPLQAGSLRSPDAESVSRTPDRLVLFPAMLRLNRDVHEFFMFPKEITVLVGRFWFIAPQ